MLFKSRSSSELKSLAAEPETDNPIIMIHIKYYLYRGGSKGQQRRPIINMIHIIYYLYRSGSKGQRLRAAKSGILLATPVATYIIVDLYGSMYKAAWPASELH
jgi:hypothetical protein